MTDSNRPRQNQDLIDGLRRFQEDFNRDFSLRDIMPELQSEETLRRTEFLDATAQLSNEQKIDKLFFTFIYIKKDVSSLIKHLKKSYLWLHEVIINSKDDKWISDYRHAIQDIPNNEDWNVHRTNYLWELQQRLKKLDRGQFLILFGKLGFGKRWLAA